jgi:hypothetical protein
MNLRRLIEKLGFRSRGERERPTPAEPGIREFDDVESPSRSQYGLFRTGGPPPGYVDDYDEGGPTR